MLNISQSQFRVVLILIVGYFVVGNILLLLQLGITYTLSDFSFFLTIFVDEALFTMIVIVLILFLYLFASGKYSAYPNFFLIPALLISTFSSMMAFTGFWTPPASFLLRFGAGYGNLIFAGLMIIWLSIIWLIAGLMLPASFFRSSQVQEKRGVIMVRKSQYLGAILRILKESPPEKSISLQEIKRTIASVSYLPRNLQNNSPTIPTLRNALNSLIKEGFVGKVSNKLANRDVNENRYYLTQKGKQKVGSDLSYLLDLVKQKRLEDLFKSLIENRHLINNCDYDFKGNIITIYLQRL